MKKIFISQSMNGKTEQAIKSERAYLKNLAESSMGEKVKVIDSYFNENAPPRVNASLWYLGESLKAMAEADIVIFARDWEEYRGCKIEHKAALAYGITIIEQREKITNDY